MEQFYSVFELLGGIALFLYGINYMSESLQHLAGENLRTILQKLTDSPLKALLVGAGVTAIIQSSGATMVMTAGFVSAQLMDMVQALYVMLGASIGTTITAQIIAFNIDPIAPLILFIGMVMFLFIKKKMVKRVGAVILGFGILFMGINVMSSAVKSMELGGILTSFIRSVSNPVVSILFGFVFTFIIQSSSASVGLLQVIIATAAGLNIEAQSLIFIIVGMNLGALAPLIISSLSGNRASKRVTLAQVISRLISAAVFSVFAALCPAFLDWIVGFSSEPSRQIANLHLAFNIFSAIIIFPITNPVAAFAFRLIPESESDEYEAQKLLYVNSEMSKGTAVMMSLARKEIERFANLCYANFSRALECFFEKDDAKAAKVLEMEKTINYINHELNVYLVQINASNKLPREEIAELGMMFNVITDLERIADHGENIEEYMEMLQSQRASVSDEAMCDLRKMSDKTLEIIRVSIDAFKTGNKKYLAEANEIEAIVDGMQEELINSHIERLKKGQCEARGGVIYTDLVSELERCSDHAMNIAESILGTNAPIEE